MPSQGASATLWAARIGLAVAASGLVLMVVSGWGYRHGWWGLRVALWFLFGAGGLMALVACAVSLAAFVLAIATTSRGAALALVGLAVGAGPGLALYRQYRLVRAVPAINDVATDLANPPTYVTAAANAFWSGKDMRYPAAFAEAVRRGYPDLTSLVLPLPPARAFTLALETARRAGWEITGSDATTGRIEATATTRWFGFEDDIVIRLAPRGPERTVVDMRSKSRVGQSDLGANAARIRAYWQALSDATH